MIEFKIFFQVDRIQAEIKQLQRNSEESATVSDKLNREVLDVEAAIQQRKSEVKITLGPRFIETHFSRLSNLYLWKRISQSGWFGQLCLKLFSLQVEKLIQEMKTANLESLTISPPEESKAFLDGEKVASVISNSENA